MKKKRGRAILYSEEKPKVRRRDRNETLLRERRNTQRRHTEHKGETTMRIHRLDIEGFRSLRTTSWHPGDLNVLIGPNGSGKSNLLRFLELLSAAAQGRLGKYVQSLGGMDPIVWDGKADSIKCVLKTSPVGDDHGPERYEFEMARLGGGSSYRIVSERLTNSLEVRSGTRCEPFIFLERAGRSAVVFDSAHKRFTPPEEYVSDEETLLSLASGPFTHNPRIPPFQRSLASITVYHDIHTNKDAPVRRPVVSRMEDRVDPDGQNLVSVLHTLYASDRDFKKDLNIAMQSAFGDDFEELVFPPASDQRVQMRIRWKSLQHCNGSSRRRRCPTERFASSSCWPSSQTPLRRP